MLFISTISYSVKCMIFFLSFIKFKNDTGQVMFSEFIVYSYILLSLTLNYVNRIGVVSVLYIVYL